MIGHRLANHHIQILGKGLANPRPIIFESEFCIYRARSAEAKMIGHQWPIIFDSKSTYIYLCMTEDGQSTDNHFCFRRASPRYAKI